MTKISELLSKNHIEKYFGKDICLKQFTMSRLQVLNNTKFQSYQFALRIYHSWVITCSDNLFIYLNDEYVSYPNKSGQSWV